MFLYLKDIGVHEIYRRATLIIASRGYSNTLTYDPYSRAVNAYGAILLACGASEKKLAEGDFEPEECGAADVMIPTICLAREYAEAMVDRNIFDWCAENDERSVIGLFNRLADRIEITVASK
jgi:hypothetical protein